MSNNLTSTDLSEIFKALGHPTKIAIFDYMMQVTDFYKETIEPVVPTLVATELGFTVPQVGACMKRMSEVGLLTRKVSGRYVFYEIDKDILSTLEEYFKL